MGHALGIGGLAQHRGLIELQQTVQVAAQMMEQRLQLVEIGGTSVDGLVVRRFRSPDVIDNLLLARFSDIGGGACKRVFESPAVFRNLALRAGPFRRAEGEEPAPSCRSRLSFMFWAATTDS